MFRRLRLLVVALLLLFSAGHALADKAGAQAKALFTEGLKQYNLGHYAEALKQFEAAYLAKPDPALLFNLAQTQRQLSQYADAERLYRAFLRESNVVGPQRVEVEKLIAQMQEAQKQALSRTPPTTLKAPEEQPTAPTEQPTQPQPAQPNPQASTSPKTGTTSPGRSLRIAGLGVGIAGLAVLVGGIALSVLAKQASDDLTAINAAGGAFDPAKDSAGRLDQTLGITFLVVGGVAAATGVVVGVLGLKKGRATRYAIAPVVGPSWNGLAFGGAF